MTDLHKYPLSLRILHWLIAFCIIGLLIVGLIMTGLSKDNPARDTLYHLHKSFGVSVLVLAAIRLVLRFTLPIPPLPAAIPRAEQILANLGHAALYGFMFLMPLSGYIMSNSFGLSVKWFGIALPRIVGVDRARGALASDIHTYAAYTLIAVISVHVLAVIWHYFHQRINLLSRML